MILICEICVRGWLPESVVVENCSQVKICNHPGNHWKILLGPGLRVCDYGGTGVFGVSGARLPSEHGGLRDLTDLTGFMSLV